MTMITKQNIGIMLLRLSLSFVFLWFGFSQLSNAAMWVSYVPTGATHIMTAGTLVLLNGLLEVTLGTLLAFGIFSRSVALILALHLLVISSSFGFTAIGVRDIGLSLATLSLFLLGTDPFCLVQVKK